MDEFFAIERNIGEVVGVIGLQNDKEQTTFDITAEMIEEKVEEEVKEKPAQQLDEEGNPIPEEEGGAEEGGSAEEKKAPAWKSTDYRWTKTNGRAKNLPQLFRDYMGNRCNFEDKNWKTYGVNVHQEAAVKALDEFCLKITDEGNSMTMY